MPRLIANRTDGDLLRCSPNSPEAFAELYRRREAVVLAFLVRRCRDPALAADLAAETFATAFLRATRFRDTGEPAIGWLLGIARHLLLDAQRRGAADRRARQRLGVPTHALSDASYERIEALDDAEAARPRLLKALDGLSEGRRSAIEAYVLEERPYAALADDLGISEQTVRQRVSRGLAQLRTELRGQIR